MTGNTKDSNENSQSIVKKIENQLDEVLIRRKQEVSKALEEKIRLEKEEAQRRLDEIEKAFEDEKNVLSKYRDKFGEIESQKTEFKDLVKKHLEKAVQYQTEIGGLTGKTLEELKKVRELHYQLEDFQKTSRQELMTIKNDLEEKFGIEAPLPVNKEHEEVDFNLEKELSKLKKIKELLGNSDAAEEPSIEYEAVLAEDELEEPIEPEAEEKPGPEPQAAYEPPAPSEELEYVAEPIPEPQRPEPLEIEKTPQFEVAPPEEPAADEVTFFPPEPAETAMESVPEADLTPRVETIKSETNFQQIFEDLEKYRKGACTEDNGDVSYFEKDDKIILDGECLMSSLSNCLDGAKKLHAKLATVESPKETFFIKQDIIRYQEILRKLMLTSIKMCEKESCKLPGYTENVLDGDILKTILEKVSMENWSDEQDFASFEKYSKTIKDAYYARITPPALYLKALLDELEKT